MALLLNPRAWLALALAGFLAFTHFSAYRAGRAAVRADFDAYKIAAQEARILADKARARRAEARQSAVDKEARDGQAKIAALESTLADTRAAGQRLRDAIRAATDGARPHPRSAGAGQGKPGADPLGVLGRLYAESDEREGALAEYADRLAIAGQTCERSYDALTSR